MEFSNVSNDSDYENHDRKTNNKITTPICFSYVAIFQQETHVCMLHNRFLSQANNKKRTNQIIDSNVTIDQIQIASKQMNMQ